MSLYDIELIETALENTPDGPAFAELRAQLEMKLAEALENTQ